MTRESKAARPDIAPRPTLWLSVRYGISNWLFELAPGDERAIVVGSLPRANVRIERRHVAPLHFHFEREGDGISLIPGYRDDLIVNGSSVSAAHSLEPRSVVRFSGVELEVAYFAIDTDLLTEVNSRPEKAASSGKQRLLSLPDSADPTRVAFRPAALPSFGKASSLPTPRVLHLARTADETRMVRSPPIVPRPIVAVGPAERPQLVCPVAASTAERGSEAETKQLWRLAAAARRYLLGA